MQFQNPSTTDVEGAALQIPVELATDAPLLGDFTADVQATEIDAETGDYTLTTIQVTFAAGSTNGAIQYVALNLSTDSLVEGDETLQLTLTNPVSNDVGGGTDTVSIGAQASHDVTITDANSATVQWQAAGTTVGEADGATNLTAVLSMANPGDTLENAASFTVTATNGTAEDADYDSGAFPKTITFAAGSGDGATQDTTIDPADDTLVEGDETVTLALSVASGAAGLGAQTTHLVTIVDADWAVVSIAPGTIVGEGGGLQTIDVTLITSGATLEPGVTISADVVDAGGGSAVSGVDYAALGTQTVTFVGGDGNGAVKTVSISPLGDRRVEGNETVLVALQNLVASPTSVGAALGNTSGVVTIDDDDSIQFDFAADTNVDENTTTHQVTVTATIVAVGTVGAPGLDQLLTVEVTDSGAGTASNLGTPPDYSFVAQTLFFAPGDFVVTSQDATVGIFEDIAFDPAETIVLFLGSLSSTLDGQASLGDTSHTVTINDDDLANLRIFDAPAPGAYTIVLNGGNIEIWQGGLGVVLLASEPIGAYQLVFNGTAAGSETLTIDFSGGNPIPSGGMVFNGGEGAGDNDMLVLTGYDLTAPGNDILTVNHTGLDNGNLVLGALGTVAFTQLEPIALAGTAANLIINLPSGADATVVLSDDGGPLDPDATQDPGFSAIRGAFEFTQFANPTVSLTINDGTGVKAISIEGLDAAWNANLTVNDEDAADDNGVTFQTNATNLGSGSLTVFGATIAVNHNVLTSSTAVPSVDLTAATALTFSASGAMIKTGDGEVRLAAGATGIAMADGSIVDGGSGTIKVTTTGNGPFQVGRLVTTNNTAAAIDINIGTGALTEAGDALGADIEATAPNAAVTIISGAFGTPGAGAIDTNVSQLSIDTSGNNADQYIREADGLAELGLHAGTGSVNLATVNAGDVLSGDAAVDITALVANVVVANGGFGSTDTSAGNAIQTSVGTLNVDTSGGNGNQFIRETDGLAELGLNAGTGTVRLFLVAGSVLSADGGTDVTAAAAVIDASAGAAGIGVLANQIQTSVSNLEAKAGTGGVFVVNTGALTLGGIDAMVGVSATGGDILIRAGSPLTVNEEVANTGGGNITLAAEGNTAADDLTIHANVTATGGNGNISLYAGDSVAVANGADIAAAGTGEIVVKAGRHYNNGSPVPGTATGDVSVAAGTRISAAADKVTIDAARSITLSDGSEVSGPARVTMNLGTANSGGVGELGGIILSNNTVVVNGGAGNDELRVMRTADFRLAPPPGAPRTGLGLRFDGAGGNDLLRIEGSDNPDNFYVDDFTNNGVIRWTEGYQVDWHPPVPPNPLLPHPSIAYQNLETLWIDTLGGDDRVTFEMNSSGPLTLTEVRVDGGNWGVNHTPKNALVHVPSGAPMPGALWDGLKIIGTDNADTIVVGTFNPAAPVPGGPRFKVHEIGILQIFGKGGDDTLTNNTSVNSFLVGGAGNDTLTGGFSSDVLVSGIGNDTLNGREGNDYLFADYDYVAPDAAHPNGQILPVAVAHRVRGDTLDGGAGTDVAAYFGADRLRNIELLRGRGGSLTPSMWLRAKYLSARNLSTIITNLLASDVGRPFPNRPATAVPPALVATLSQPQPSKKATVMGPLPEHLAALMSVVMEDFPGGANGNKK